MECSREHGLKLRFWPWMLCPVAMLLVNGVACADPVEDAKKLQAEAQQILRMASEGAADPKTYAKAVVMLERAESLLAKAAQNNPKAVEGIQEEVTAALFWARRFANVDVIDALRDKESGSRLSKTDPAKTPEPAKADARRPETEPRVPEPERSEPRKPAPPPSRPPAPPRPLSEAEAEVAYNKAMAFENTHRADHYAVALRWFQMADQFSGTHWSIKALTRARNAQRLFRQAQKNAELSKTHDGKLIVEGNALLDQERFKEALGKFEEANAVARSVLADRSIGYTFLKVAYKKRDEFKAKYLPLEEQFREARRRRDKGRMKALAKQRRRLSSLEGDVVHCYTQAQQAFSRGLELAGGKDLECEAQLGIIYYWVRKRPLALIYLERVVGKYTPQNDEERAVHEYSRSLLRQIRGW